MPALSALGRDSRARPACAAQTPQNTAKHRKTPQNTAKRRKTPARSRDAPRACGRTARPSPRLRGEEIHQAAAAVQPSCCRASLRAAAWRLCGYAAMAAMRPRDACGSAARAFQGEVCDDPARLLGGCCKRNLRHLCSRKAPPSRVTIYQCNDTNAGSGCPSPQLHWRSVCAAPCVARKAPSAVQRLLKRSSVSQGAGHLC